MDRLFVAGINYRAGEADWPVERRFRRTGRNIGNLLVGYGARQQFRNAEFGGLISTPPERIRERFDRVAVVATNFLHRAVDFSAQAAAVEAVDLPCAVVGLGAQANGSEPIARSLPAGTVRFVEALAERTPVIGVRGAYTASVLDDLGVTNVEVTGCPSFYANLSAPLRLARKRFADIRRIAVNGTADVVGHSFDGEAKARVERALFRHAAASNHPYVLQSELPEMLYLDEPGPQRAAALAPSARRLGYDSVDDYAAAVRRIGRVFFDVDEWLDFVGGQDLVVGTRLHGAVAALLRGVPAIVLYHDARTRELCELMRLPSLSVSEAAGLSLEAIHDRVRFDAVEARHAAMTSRYVDLLERNGVAHAFAVRSARPASAATRSRPGCAGALS